LENQLLLAICFRFLGDVNVKGKQQPQAARQYYQQALARLNPLAQQNPEVVEYQTERGGIYMNLAYLEIGAGDQGDAAALKAALEQARDIFAPLVGRFPTVPRYRRNLAVTLRELAFEQHADGDVKLAGESLAESKRLLEELVSQYPQETEYAEQLAETNAVELGPLPPAENR
jgi:hypothetical protein